MSGPCTPQDGSGSGHPAICPPDHGYRFGHHEAPTLSRLCAHVHPPPPVCPHCEQVCPCCPHPYSLRTQRSMVGASSPPHQPRPTLLPPPLMQAGSRPQPRTAGAAHVGEKLLLLLPWGPSCSPLLSELLPPQPQGQALTSVATQLPPSSGSGLALFHFSSPPAPTLVFLPWTRCGLCV